MCRVVSAKSYSQAKKTRPDFIERPRVDKIAKPKYTSDAITSQIAQERIHGKVIKKK